jgi:RNA polymerase sigma-70 factor (ECF subfamily)
MMAEDLRTEPPSDEELVQRAKDGDSRAMDVLVDRHHGAVFRTCVAILGEEDLAADASQDCFIKAFRALGRFRGDAAFRTWLLAIAGNEARGQLRKVGRRKERGLEDVDTISAPGHDPSTEVTLRSEADRVRAAVDELPQKQRLSVTLRIDDGLSFREIGEIIGSSEGSARVNYHHGIRRLRELLEP